MTDITLKAFDDHVGLNDSASVGIMQPDTFTGSQTRSTLFTPEYLREWAELIEEAYSDETVVEVVHTPDCPMVAKKYNGKGGEESTIGVAVAPRVHQEEYEETTGEEL